MLVRPFMGAEGGFGELAKVLLITQFDFGIRAQPRTGANQDACILALAVPPGQSFLFRTFPLPFLNTLMMSGWKSKEGNVRCISPPSAPLSVLPIHRLGGKALGFSLPQQ